MGLYDQSLLLSKTSLTWAKLNGNKQLQDQFSIAKSNIIMLSLQQEFDQKVYRGKTFLSDSASKKFLEKYWNAFQGYESSFNGVANFDARLKWLRLYQQLVSHAGQINNELINEYYRSLEPEAFKLLEQLQGMDVNNDDIKDTEPLRLLSERAKILLNAGSSKAKDDVQTLLELAYQKSSKHYSAKAYALLGEWYQNQAKFGSAIQAYQTASQLGDKRLPLYQYQFEIAKLFEKIGKVDQAKRFYQSSITLAESVQADISPLSSEVKRNFQESIRPIYDHIIFSKFKGFKH